MNKKSIYAQEADILHLKRYVKLKVLYDIFYFTIIISSNIKFYSFYYFFCSVLYCLKHSINHLFSQN